MNSWRAIVATSSVSREIFMPWSSNTKSNHKSTNNFTINNNSTLHVERPNNKHIIVNIIPNSALNHSPKYVNTNNSIIVEWQIRTSKRNCSVSSNSKFPDAILKKIRKLFVTASWFKAIKPTNSLVYLYLTLLRKN